MIASIRKSIDENESGFTLIELLVVMIIIGILAAIAIPVFLNQRVKAANTAAKADVSTIGKEIATYYVDGSGALTVTGAAGAALWTITNSTPATVTTGPLSGKNTATGSATNQDSFCAAVDASLSVSGAVSWKYTQAGLVQGTC